MSTIPGIDPDTTTPVPLCGEAYTGTDAIEVRAPYDGKLLGRVPALTAGDVDRAVQASARARAEQPLPQWRRAEILDRAAAGLAARVEEFAIGIALESAKPIRTARV